MVGCGDTFTVAVSEGKKTKGGHLQKLMMGVKDSEGVP